MAKERAFLVKQRKSMGIALDGAAKTIEPIRAGARDGLLLRIA